ncbi:MAG: hypothetical protein H8K04_15045 [Nitrospira sp.]
MSRVLSSGVEPPGGLHQLRCHRCGKEWWPRQPRKPARCPGCKSPYWDRPRRIRHTVASLQQVHDHSLTQLLQSRLGQQTDGEDRSLARALSVLKEMKAAGRTWQEMGDRLEREFGTRLDKDQLKALVR